MTLNLAIILLLALIAYHLPAKRPRRAQVAQKSGTRMKEMSVNFGLVTEVEYLLLQNQIDGAWNHALCRAL